jgi:hypothetical protein
MIKFASVWRTLALVLAMYWTHRVLQHQHHRHCKSDLFRIVLFDQSVMCSQIGAVLSLVETTSNHAVKGVTTYVLGLLSSFAFATAAFAAKNAAGAASAASGGKAAAGAGVASGAGAASGATHCAPDTADNGGERAKHGAQGTYKRSRSRSRSRSPLGAERGGELDTDLAGRPRTDSGRGTPRHNDGRPRTDSGRGTPRHNDDIARRLSSRLSSKLRDEQSYDSDRSDSRGSRGSRGGMGRRDHSASRDRSDIRDSWGSLGSRDSRDSPRGSRGSRGSWGNGGSRGSGGGSREIRGEIRESERRRGSQLQQLLHLHLRRSHSLPRVPSPPNMELQLIAPSWPTACEMAAVR